MKKLIVFILAIIGCIMFADISVFSMVLEHVSHGIKNINPGFIWGGGASLALVPFMSYIQHDHKSDGGNGKKNKKDPDDDDDDDDEEKFDDMSMRELKKYIKKNKYELDIEDDMDEDDVIDEIKLYEKEAKEKDNKKKKNRKKAVIDPALKTEIDTITEDIADKWDELEDASDREIKKATKGVMKDVKKLLEKRDILTEKQQEFIEDQQDQLDELDINIQKMKDSGPVIAKTKYDHLIDAFKDNAKAIKSVPGGGKTVIDLPPDFMKAGDMTSGNTYTGDVVVQQRVPGIVHDPDRSVHVRQFLPVGTTQSSGIDYVEETAIDDGTAATAEGAAKPQSDFDLENKNSSVKKLSTFLRLSEEMLADNEALASYIESRFGRKLMLVEDTQLLYGDGTGVNLAGITTLAQAAEDKLADANVNQYDVITAAIQQLEEDEFMPNVVFLHPTDWWNTVRLKDANNQYLFPSDIRNGASFPIGGVPVVKSTAVVADDFVVGDFRIGSQIFDRRRPQIEFSTQDADNFQKDMVSARLFERLAFPTFLPNAYVFGDFTTMLAKGSA